MRGGLWLCLAVVVLLVPLAAGDHKRGPLIDIDLDDDEREREREEERKREEEEKKREEEERKREEEERKGEEKEREARERLRAEAGPEGCIQASGGATEDGNVVSWPAQDRPVDLHRKAGEGAWTRVHEAAPGEELYMDHDLKKGRTYAYRITHANASAQQCPALEMTAVPFMAGAVGYVVGLGAAVFLVARK